MTERIFLGSENSNQTFRISQIGHSATDKKNPLVFSSDNDYLRVHYKGRKTLNKQSFSDGWTDHWGKATFPPLSYYPIVWWKASNNGRGVDQSYWFPYGPAGDSNQVLFVNCVVGKNGIWFSANTLTAFGWTVEIDFIIFENELKAI